MFRKRYGKKQRPRRERGERALPDASVLDRSLKLGVVFGHGLVMLVKSGPAPETRPLPFELANRMDTVLPSWQNLSQTLKVGCAL
jgi:hypothetical protein